MEGSEALFELRRTPLIRTKDVYQTNVDDGVVGYSDTLLAVVANFKNGGAPEGFNAQSMAGNGRQGRPHAAKA